MNDDDLAGRIIALAFSDELEKIAGSAFAKHLRAASPEKAKQMVDRSFRQEGMRPPYRSVKDYVDPEVREMMIKGIRRDRNVKVPEVAPRGSPLWRKAMKDIKAGRVSTFESGLSRKQGKNILKTGPSTQGGLPLEENMRAVSDAMGDTRYAARQVRRKKRRAVERRFGKDSPEADAMEDDRYSVMRGLDAKTRSGLYAADKGTRRTADYAHRAAGGSKGEPAALRFELPHSMARPGTYSELRIPHDFFKRWARKPRVETIGEEGVGKVLHRRRKLPG